jgi:hypothetical protein
LALAATNWANYTAMFHHGNFTQVSRKSGTEQDCGFVRPGTRLTDRRSATDDWLVTPNDRPASYVEEQCWTYDGSLPQALCGLELGNGHMARRFLTTPAFGTIDYLERHSPAWRSAVGVPLRHA